MPYIQLTLIPSGDASPPWDAPQADITAEQSVARQYGNEPVLIQHTPDSSFLELPLQDIAVAAPDEIGVYVDAVQQLRSAPGFIADVSWIFPNLPPADATAEQSVAQLYVQYPIISHVRDFSWILEAPEQPAVTIDFDIPISIDPLRLIYIDPDLNRFEQSWEFPPTDPIAEFSVAQFYVEYPSLQHLANTAFIVDLALVMITPLPGDDCVSDWNMIVPAIGAPTDIPNTKVRLVPSTTSWEI